MDLFCPHCTSRVTVPDDKAGQVLSCPLCAKQFMAPSLPPPAVAPKPPGPAPMSPAPAPPPSTPAAPKPTAPALTPAAPPSPPLPPGEYTRHYVFELRVDWLVFVAPACVLAIFFLSLLTWHSRILDPDPANTIPALNLWGLAFERAQAQFLAYVLLMLVGIPLTVLMLPLDKGWIPAPPQLAPLLTFKNLIVTLILALAFLLLCYDYADAHLVQKTNPIALAMKIAFRLHFVATLASALMFWLHWRKRSNLPAPKGEVRW